MEHNEHMMVLMYSHLDGTSAGENIADSCCGSPHATCVPRRIRMDLQKSFW
jgi:hypothetical protein